MSIRDQMSKHKVHWWGWAGWLEIVLLAASVQVPPTYAIENGKPSKVPFFTYLTGAPTPAMIAYSPSELDPRFDGNHAQLPTISIRADLQALRPVFDGLVLYGYHPQSTPRIVSVAKELKFRAVLLGIWDPRSSGEIDGVDRLVRQFENDLALGIVIGNEGLTFHRYEPNDLTSAAERVRCKLPKTIPLTTSEPLGGYRSAFVREFGDFLAPNIHPVFDRPSLSAADAAAWVRQEAANLARTAKRPVLVKETGFPHDGKDGFTPETQKAFWGAYLKPGLVARIPDLPQLWVFHGVAFEAFDLPWKAEATNMPIEKSWGLFSKDRRSHPALSVWRALARADGRQSHLTGGRRHEHKVRYGAASWISTRLSVSFSCWRRDPGGREAASCNNL